VSSPFHSFFHPHVYLQNNVVFLTQKKKKKKINTELIYTL